MPPREIVNARRAIWIILTHSELRKELLCHAHTQSIWQASECENKWRRDVGSAVADLALLLIKTPEFYVLFLVHALTSNYKWPGLVWCVQALQQLCTGRKVLLGLAAALLLAAAAQLGRGASPISVAAVAPVLGALASVWLSEKFAGWQAKFVYSDYDHTARDWCSLAIS
jgi:hypothetical protein